MKAYNLKKSFVISLVFGFAAIALFIFSYSECSWGCSGGPTFPISITLILFVISCVYFFKWLWAVIKLTFGKNNEKDLKNLDNKRDILLSILSIAVIGYTIYFLRLFVFSHHLKYPYILLALLAIVGAAGVWFNKRWGAFVLILIFSIIFISQILSFISRLPDWYVGNVVGFTVFIALIITLSIKFKGMK